MAEYQVIARKFRPRLFSEVVGQDAIVTTLINAIKLKRSAHAYLFCGSRGTGKTTLARLFAKALNCKAPLENREPCNGCSSCKEIDAFHAMDVIEIDGASHRGIEDVRQINETIVYAPQGNYKIYIIDEVHMLTKEAFNALLKSLEEPPEKVKFFFATTEPHKIPATILSRCQRFNLSRITPDKMGEKLSKIALELGIEVEKEALALIAELSCGGLRDAESLFDQLISYYGKRITAKGVTELFGLLPKERLAELDRAVANQDVTFAFQLASEVFASGKNMEYFLEELISHYREVLLKKSPAYTEEQCLNILEMLAQAENEMKFAFSPKTTLEMVLIRIIRSAKRISLESLVERLCQLENKLIQEKAETPKSPLKVEQSSPVQKTWGLKEKSPAGIPPVAVVEGQKEVAPETLSRMQQLMHPAQKSAQEKAVPKVAPEVVKESLPAEKISSAPGQQLSIKEKSRYDTVMRFAAKELGGSLKKE